MSSLVVRPANLARRPLADFSGGLRRVARAGRNEALGGLERYGRERLSEEAEKRPLGYLILHQVLDATKHPIGGYNVNGVMVQHVIQLYVAGTGGTAGSYGFTFGYNSANNIFSSTRYLPTSASSFCSTPLEYSNYNLDIGKPGNSYRAGVVGFTSTATANWVLVGFFY